MANFNSLKQEIDQNVNTNGQQAITGAILNKTLKDMVDDINDQKQDTLVAGQNIQINGNVISATGGGGGQTYQAGWGLDLYGSTFSVDVSDLDGTGLKADAEAGVLEIDPNVVATQNDLAGLQPALTAGSNIQINGTTISATDTTYSAGSNVSISAQNVISATDTTYSAGSNVSISAQNVISATDTTYSAGDGIDIDGNNEISIKAGTGLSFDANGYLVNTGGGGGGTTYTAGDGIDIDQNDAINVQVGSGLTINGNNEVEVDTAGLNFLPLDGGVLQDTTGINDTILDVESPKNVASVVLDAGDDGSQYDPQGTATISLADSNGSLRITTSGFSDGTYNLQMPSLSGDDVIATSGDLSGYLPLTGGQIQGTGDTELEIIDEYGEDYVKIVAPETPGVAPHIEIYENGSGDTKYFYDHIERGSQVSIDLPSSSGTIALTSDIAGKQDTLTAGDGIDIDANDEISVKLGSGLQFNASGEIETTGGGGSGLWSSGTGSNSLLAPNTAATGGTATQTGAISCGNDTDATSVGAFAGGNQTTASGSNSFAYGDSSVASGAYSAAFGQNNQSSGSSSFTAGQNNVNAGNHAVAFGSNNNISSAGVDAAAIGGSLNVLNNYEVALGYKNKSYLGSNQTTADDNVETIFTLGNGDGNGTSNSIEVKKNNDVYVVGVGSFDGTNSANASTLQTVISGKQDTLTAGTGISISGNVISATGGGGTSLWTSGSGTGSVMSPGASQANGNYGVSAGDGTKANGLASVALGANTTASGTYSTAIGSGSSATNSYSVAIGHGVQVANQDETALGTFNLYTNSGTNAQKTQFTIGNGTGVYAKSNLLEAKQNNDIYVVGVGGYDGTNAGASGVETLQDAINNAGGGGSYLPLSGGILQEDPNDGDTTNLEIDNPSGSGLATINISAYEDMSDPQDPQGQVNIYLNDTQGSLDISTTGISDTNYTCSWPTLTQDTTFATLDDVGNFLPLDGGILQDTTGNDSTILTIESPNSQNSVSLSVDDNNATTELTFENNMVMETDPDEGESNTIININQNGEQGISAGIHSELVDDGHYFTPSSFSSFVEVSAPGGQNTTGRVNIYANSSGLDDPGNETSDAYIEIEDQTGYISLAPGGFNDGAYDLSFPGLSQNETIATLSDIPSASSLAGDGLQDDGNGALEIKLGSGLQFDANGAIETTGGGGGTSYTAGNGIDITGSTISVDETYLDSVYLPILGGSLENTQNHTDLRVDAPNAESDNFVDILSPGTGVPSVELGTDTNTQGDVESLKFKGDGDINIKYVGDNTTYTLSFPTLSQNETIATLSDIQGGGGTTYTAGDGINISAQDVISSTTFKRGTGSNSIRAIQSYTTASGANSFAVGESASASASDAVAIGYSASASGIESVAIGKVAYATSSDAAAFGYSTSAAGEYATALGCYAQTKNNYEVGLGKYNKSINSGTNAEKTQFTVGCGTASNSRANLIEAKQNKDIYVYGIGGFDGTNASQADTLQTVIANAGGGGLWSSGSGRDSLVAPGTVSAGLTGDAAGNGAVSCGYDSNANGDYSFAQGGASTADGDYSFVANNGTANGDYAAAFGTSGANGDYSFAAGYGSAADAAYSVALAGGNVIFDDFDPNDVIDAQYGVAIGYNSQASGSKSMAIGSETSAYGQDSVALGYGSSCNGNNSVAIAGGNSNGTYSTAISGGTADGQNAVALAGGFSIGDNSVAGGPSYAYGYGSAAFGLNVSTYDSADGTDYTDPNAGEAAFGRYNYSEAGLIFTVGCGYEDNTDPDNPAEVRENAIAIDNTGKIFLKGLGGYTGTSTSGCTDLVSFLNNL